MSAQPRTNARSAWPLQIAAASLLGALLVYGASCSLGADLDTGPIDALRCDADEECPVGSVCASNGYCDPPPDPDNPPAPCEFSRCGALCVDLQTDVGHCGGCDVVCPGDQSCVAGVCACAGERCDGVCVDLQTDAANCGSCGRACAATESCVAGVCGCLPEEARCGAACANFATSDAHCGGCDLACGAGASCSGGACACDVGSQIFCDGACVDTSSNASHCGGCGVVCASGAGCRAGECRCDSNPNGDICISSAAGVATASCSMRTCNLTCTATTQDCNGSAIDGCEGAVGCP